MATATYDPKDVSIIIGSHIVSGFADGTFIRVERNNAMWTTQTGASGETVRQKSNDRSGKITISLMEHSPTNDILAGYLQADEVKNAGTFPFIMTHAGRNEIHEATQCWVENAPGTEKGKDASTREWVLQTGELATFSGGMK